MSDSVQILTVVEIEGVLEHVEQRAHGNLAKEYILRLEKMYMSLLRKCLTDEKSEDQRNVARGIISQGGLSTILSFEKNIDESRDLCSVLCRTSGLTKNNFNSSSSTFF